MRPLCRAAESGVVVRSLHTGMGLATGSGN